MFYNVHASASTDVGGGRCVAGHLPSACEIFLGISFGFGDWIVTLAHARIEYERIRVSARDYT